MEPRRLRMLLVEDVPADAELMLAELAQGGVEADVQRVDREDAYLAALDPSLDIVLSDFNVPGFGAMRALEILKERAPDVPFIVVSGSIGEETAVALLRTRISSCSPSSAAPLRRTASIMVRSAAVVNRRCPEVPRISFADHP